MAASRPMPALHTAQERPPQFRQAAVANHGDLFERSQAGIQNGL